MTSKTKNLESIGNSGHFGLNPEVVTHFRLTTEHDFLRVYLHWLGVAANGACPICGHARMDGDQLLQCTGLDEYPVDGIVSRNSETRCQMVKKPSTGIG
ncbi:reverse transcriptase [Trichonephila clavipes]|nr:reverse transcriptase [Trichonephila clavipes]